MKNIYKIGFALFFISLCIINAEEVKEEDDVLVLTDKNFQETVSKHTFILVEFYAPWCGHCKNLAPEYAKAAKALKKNDPYIPLGKVDATKESAIASKYQVSGYPTLKFFINGEPIEYNGGRTEDGIITWVKKKTGPPSTPVVTVDEAKKLVETNKVLVMYLGSEGSSFESFEKSARGFDDVVFAHSFSTDVKSHFGVEKDEVVMFRDFDDGRKNCNCDLTTEKITDFINQNRFPIVFPFEESSIKRIFEEQNPCLFLFLGTDEKSKTAEQELRTAASTLKGRILLSTSNVNEGLGPRLAEYVGVTTTDVPTVRIVSPKDKLLKYKLEGDLVSDNLIDFVGKFERNQLSPFLKSEPVPETNDGPVKVLVGKNFEELVLKSGKDVLVEFYAPWCGHCKKLAPIYDKLGELLKVNPNIVIAKMDSTANEVDSVDVRGFPTLKFYQSNSPSPLDYEGERNLAGFVKYLQSKTTFPWVDVGEVKEETKEEAKPPKEEDASGDDPDVLVLTKENFDEEFSKHEYMLIEFYAPWCGHCKSLKPEYAKAATELKNADPPVILAKVDATKERELAEKYKVSGYPTLKFFIRGEPIEYEGGRTHDTIVSWIKKKVGVSTVQVNTVEDAEKIVSDHDVVVMFLGEEGSNDFAIFDSVSKNYDDLTFAHTFSSDVKAKYGVTKTNVVMFRKFDEGRVDCNCEMDTSIVKSFIDSYRFPVVFKFEESHIKRIFEEGAPTLFVFHEESDTKSLEEMKLASTELKGKILLSTSQIKDGLGQRLGEYIGVTPESLPTARIVEAGADKLLKYQITGSVTAENLVKFYEQWSKKEIKPFLKSEEIPEKNDAPVKVVVGKNFENIVLDNTKDVLVEYYAPWCGHCQKLAPIYDEVATMMKSNPNIVIAKMDATANEVESVHVSGFPTIKFYPSNNKAAPIDFSGDRDVNGFITFLKQKTTLPWVNLEGDVEAEKDKKVDDKKTDL